MIVNNSQKSLLTYADSYNRSFNSRFDLQQDPPSIVVSTPSRISQFFRGKSCKIVVHSSRNENLPGLLRTAHEFFTLHGPKNPRETYNLFMRIWMKFLDLLAKYRQRSLPRPTPSSPPAELEKDAYFNTLSSERLRKAYPLPVASKLEEIINGRFQKIKKELLAQNKYTIDEKIDGKEYKIKFRSSKDGPSVYVRQYLAAGGFNRVERLIGLTGKEWETMWDVAYTKHRKDKAHSKPEKNSSPSSNNFPELAIAQRLHNAPFVLNYSPVYYRKDPTKIKATLSPFCNAGDLDSYIKQKTAHPIEDKLAIAIQLAKGIAEMHARGVVHVDLKPKNILLTSHGEERHVRIADFGLSCPVGTSKPFAGTITYAPPEQVEAKTAKIIMHAKKSLDVWAFGNILAELMYHHKINVFSSSKAAILQSENEELFQKYHDLRSIMKKIISGEPLPKAILQSGNKELFQKYYDEMRKLISKKPLPKTIKNDVNRTILTCLQLDPDERPEMPAVVRTLQKIRQTLIENMEQPS